MRSERAAVRPIIWLLSVALCVVGLSIAAPANADPVGSIAGVVTGPDGELLEEVQVRAYQWDDEDEYWYQVATTSTDDEGHYELSELASGAYRLRIRDLDHRGYLTEYWDDAATIESAADVPVVLGETTVRNTQLSQGGHITGAVTDTDGNPAGGVYVQAYRWDPDDEYWGSVSDGSTDDQGHYDIGNLATGTYRVGFDDGFSTGLVGEYWDDAESIMTATDIPVASGETTSGTNAQLARSGSITGTVTASGDLPLEGIAVTSYIWNADENNWDAAAGGYTGEDGVYTLGGMRAGTYRVGYQDYSGDYQAEYWDDAADVRTADDVVVTSGGTTPGKDAQLAEGGHLTGTVTGPDGQPVEAVSVTAYRWDPAAESWQAVLNRSTDGAGTYDINGLATGDYRLRFLDTSGNGHLTEYWDDAATLATATTIPVAVDTTVGGKNAQLAPGGRIVGTVTAPGGGAAPSVDVAAYRWDSVDESWEWYDDVYTDDDGDYRLVSLPTGTYRLMFDPGSESNYLSEYWNDAATLATATSISVTAGDVVTGRNAELTEGGHITGTVTGPDSQGAGDVYVQAYQWNAQDEYWDAVNGSSTDGAGQYDIRGLPTGTYRLRFTDESGGGYVREFWDDAPTLGTATDIAVTAGATASGKNAQLGAGAHLTGTVTGPGGAGLDDVYVDAFVWDAAEGYWASVDGDDTNGTGSYNIGGLVAGTYRLGFFDQSGNGYVTEYWDGAATIQDADDITVGAGATIAARDAELSLPAIDNSALPTVSGTPQVGSTLIATTGTWEPSVDLSFGYQWLVSGEPVTGATASTYVPVASDVGKTVRVKVTVTSPGHAPATATSAATNAVTAATVPAVANITPPAITGTPQVGTTSTTTPGTWSPAGATLGYQWLLAGSSVPGATGPTYQPVAADAGKQLQVQVTAAVAGHTTGTATSTPVAVGKGTLKATKKPKVTGKAKKNATLKVSPGTWSPKAKITFQWYAGAKAIPKATAAKLKLAGKTLKTVKGKAISVLLTITAPGYNTVTTKLKVPGKVRR